MNDQKKMFLIKLPYWLGIVADAFWAVVLFFPGMLASVTGNQNFIPNYQVKQVMWIGGILMTGWTVLLLWAVKKPVERRGVILITAFPVVFGLFVVTLLGILNGNSSNVWILVKTVILFISMATGYILAVRMERE